MKNFISGIPKAELHLHIEGSFEPGQMFGIAARNGVRLKYKSVEDLRNAYNFHNLQEFLDIYYAGASALKTVRDFYDLTYAYAQRASADGVQLSEIFFDPQTHLENGIPFGVFFEGMRLALNDARKDFGLESSLIMCFLRHLDEKSAFETWDLSEPFRNQIAGVGLDSSEVGHPPSKFASIFAKARDAGMKLVAHAGEEGPPEYIREAIEILGVQRIDHGNRVIEDPELLAMVINRRLPLTMCPLSNLKLAVVGTLSDHPLKKLLDAGVVATVNSDDPAYFGGYIASNYFEIQQALELTKDQVVILAKNSFTASFASDEQKAKWLAQIDEYVSNS